MAVSGRSRARDVSPTGRQVSARQYASPMERRVSARLASACLITAGGGTISRGEDGSIEAIAEVVLPENGARG